MILVSNSAAQTLNAGQAITFDTVLLKTGTGECCRNNAARTVTSAKLKQCGNYEIQFHGNVGGPTADADVSLAIAVDGVILPETIMLSTPSVAVTEGNSVSAFTVVSNTCGDSGVITVINNGTNPNIVFANTALLIRRIS